MMERGIDWAYARLVNKALECEKHEVRELAKIFRKEVLDACFGMACADIDHHAGRAFVYAYETVKDVCNELTRN